MASWLRRQWFLVGMAVALLVAGTAGQAIAPWTQAIPVSWLAATTIFLVAAGLPARNLWLAIRRPGPVLLALAVSYLLAPLLAKAMTSLLAQPYQLGLIIGSTVPCTLASAVIWTRLAGGNAAVALLVTITSNAAVFLVAPFWLTNLANTAVVIDVQPMMLTLLAFVVVPIILGQLIRLVPVAAGLLEDYRGVIKEFCQFLILTIIFKSAVLASLQLDRISIGDLLWVTCVCVGLHALLLAIGYRVGRALFTRADAVGVAFSGSQKTLQVGALLIERHFASEPLAIVPVLAYHMGQLFLDTWIVESVLRDRPDSPAEPAAEAAPGPAAESTPG